MKSPRAIALIAALAALPSAATTYPVGPTRTWKSPCGLVAAVALQPGDVVEVDPATYTDACQLTASGTQASPIVLRGVPGVPRPVFDATGLDLSGSGSVPRAIFQFTGGSHWRVQHLELKNASNASANGAAFRLTAGSLDVVIDDVSVHDCQDGFMSDGPATLTVRSSDVFRNGAGDGYSHNFYVQGQSIVLIGNHIHDSRAGQNVKVRSHDALIAYNLIENAGNYEIDLIQGPLTDAANANATLIGNVIIRPATADNNSQVILWGSDDPTASGRNGSLYAISNTFVLANASNRLFHAISPPAGSQIHLVNSIVQATVGGTGLAADATTSAILVGSNDWISSQVTSAGALTSVLTGASPGFVSATDLHLVPGSPAIGAGAAGVTSVDGSGSVVNAAPDQEFMSPLGTRPRAPTSVLDLGAFGFTVASDGGIGDAGSADAGSTDAGGGDAGSGGAPDAGSDGGAGGSVDAPAPDIIGSCSSSSESAPWLGLAVLAGLVARRRSVNS